MESSHFIPTRASRDKKNKNAEANFKTYKFESYKKKIRNKEAGESSKQSDKSELDTVPEFKLKKAKHDVWKLGVSGFETLTKEEAKIQQAIKLGAKPPKKKFVNYKELLETKKKERLAQKQIDLRDKDRVENLNSTLQRKKFGQKKNGSKSIIDLYGTTKVKVRK